MASARLKSTPSSPRTAPTENTANLRIEGGFRTITTHQLCLSWWLYQSGHMTRRQLRVYFAAHEMAARRAATVEQGGRAGSRKPLYSVEELAVLVGGRGSPEASAALSGDVRALGRLGLVKLAAHSLEFAVSADEIRVEDLSGFWSMVAQVANARRSVPVPRRMLRALAAGFSRGTMAMVIAMLIRSVFWHRETQSYRMDGRTKGSWVAETFGISRRAVTDARAHLMALGWLRPIETPQWAMNRWGAHDAINAAWNPSAAEQGRALSGSASPSAEIAPQSASPCLNSSPSPTENQKTITPEKPDPTGVSSNSRKAKAALRVVSKPDLRDVRTEHLERTQDLLELHGQAVASGLIDSSESSQLEFFAYAERARAHGTRPGALFMWLLRGKRAKFITQADEDSAHARLREYRNSRARQFMLPIQPAKPVEHVLSEDERFYLLCLQIARRERIEDPFRVAFIGKKWTRPQWDAVKAAYEAGQRAAMQDNSGWSRLLRENAPSC